MTAEEARAIAEAELPARQVPPGATYADAVERYIELGESLSNEPEPSRDVRAWLVTFEVGPQRDAQTVQPGSQARDVAIHPLCVEHETRRRQFTERRCNLFGLRLIHGFGLAQCPAPVVPCPMRRPGSRRAPRSDGRMLRPMSASYNLSNLHGELRPH